MMMELENAASHLKHDRLVAMPTETVYGLAGNALSDRAVAAIYEAKGRPSFNPLIVHVLSVADAEKYAVVTHTARRLMERFWPGALTLVMKRKENCPLSLLASAGLDTVAMRSPAHPLARQLLEISGLPLAAPSANRSGRISPTQAAHVREELGDKLAAILDGADCALGIESTVVDATGDAVTILRPGSITHEQLEEIVPVAERRGGGIASPGMLESHYAPAKPLRINAKEAGKEEGLLAFGKPLAGARVTYNLSETASLQEAAANLFRMLRLLDASGVSSIAAMVIPEEGLGIAINDRLRRAAAR